MINGKGNILRATIGALSLPFFEEKLTNFIALQRSLFVFLLHRRRVELEVRQAHRTNRRDLAQPIYPGHHIGQSALLRGGQPSLWFGPVEEPRRSVACFALPSIASQGSPSLQRTNNL